MSAVIGIDLGTSFSSAAAIRDDSVVQIPDEAGRHLTHSMVHFGEAGDISVGDAARRLAIEDPENTIISAKRLLGRRFNEGSVRIAQSAYVYKVTEGPNQWPLVEARGGPYTVAEVCACILKELKTRAERFFGEPVTQAVITVPAHADDAQREQTRLAGRIAGLEVLRLLNEPTAAAIAYALEGVLGQTVAVYDFGGGTFDCSVLEWKQPASKVLSTHGNSFLGGDDVDLALAEHIAQEFETFIGANLKAKAAEWRQLMLCCEEAKRALSRDVRTRIFVKDATTVEGGPVDLDFPVTRDLLERLAYPYIQETIEIMLAAISMAGLTADQLDEVILVGGSTRLPLVRSALRAALGRAARDFDVEPELAVSVGAAVEAHRLSGGRSKAVNAIPSQLVDVVPHGIGLATAGGGFDQVIPRNAPLPASGRRAYTTWRDDQEEMRFVVLEGDGERADDCARLGEFIIDGLPAKPAGTVEVELLFEVGADGLLRASARDKTTNSVHHYRNRIQDSLPGK